MDNYIWNGTELHNIDISWVGTNSVGCDSTATLVLTINLPTKVQCDVIVTHGMEVTYTTSGTYTWSGTNS